MRNAPWVVSIFVMFIGLEFVIDSTELLIWVPHVRLVFTVPETVTLQKFASIRYKFKGSLLYVSHFKAVYRV